MKVHSTGNLRKSAVHKPLVFGVCVVAAMGMVCLGGVSKGAGEK